MFWKGDVMGIWFQYPTFCSYYAAFLHYINSWIVSKWSQKAAGPINCDCFSLFQQFLCELAILSVTPENPLLWAF